MKKSIKKGGVEKSMETIVLVKNFIIGGAAIAISALSNMLGGWDITLQSLICFMAIDYITGLIVAGVFHKSGKSQSGTLESRAGFKGLLRKCSILFLVLLGVMLDKYTGRALVRPAVCLFFIGNEGLSILENIGLMGVQYPEFLKNMLEVIKKEGDNGQQKHESEDDKE